MAQSLTHFSSDGEARMVDVGDKPITQRLAVARGRLRMLPATAASIRNGSVAKGDVLQVARLAAIHAAKSTGMLIPLCHPLALEGVEVRFQWLDDVTLECQTTVRCSGKTGVEIEALTATSIACVTVYDMCKSIDRQMEIVGLAVLQKSGGKSGVQPSAEAHLT